VENDLMMRNKKRDKDDKFACQMPFTSTAGRNCYCTFRDFGKLAFHFDRTSAQMIRNGTTKHRHYNDIWKELERRVGVKPI
jgi:hypothetical protein